MYKVKYSGTGQIEMCLPSKPGTLTIKHGDYARLNLTDEDKKCLSALKHLGVTYEAEKNKKAAVEVKEEPVVEVNESVVDSKEKVSKEELMKKTSKELKAQLKDLGVKDTDSLTKSELADKILEVSND